MLKNILKRVKPHAEKITAGLEAGFRAERSTTEQIFNLRILCEKKKRERKAQAGNEWSMIFPKSPQARKKLLPPP